MPGKCLERHTTGQIVATSKSFEQKASERKPSNPDEFSFTVTRHLPRITITSTTHLK